MSKDITDLGGISWQLALSLLGAWVLTILCLIKGVRSVGKVSKLFSPFLYIL